jgi:hypothetical protein
MKITAIRVYDEKLRPTIVNVTPAIFHNEVYNDYWVCVDTGDIYSTKGSYGFKKLKPAGTTAVYPKVHLRKERKAKTVRIHRLVGHTLIPMNKKPENMSDTAWEIVKNNQELLEYIYAESMELNHIDENKWNYHPSNLEWVSRSGNRDAYWNSR